MTRRVLILAYFFPPAGSGGVLRTTKFVKYLVEFGWNSTVVAPAWSLAEGKDVGFGVEVPADTHVVRAGLAGDDGALWRMLDSIPYAWRWFRRVRAGVDFPDGYRRWIPTALGEARRLLRLEPVDVVFSTSPPVSSHAVAMRLKEETGVPWVADFRDPWTDNRLAYTNPWRWRRRIDVRFERRIYQTADRVIANTRTNRRVMIERHHVPEEKVVTIPNGYDEADFAGLAPYGRGERFRILYAGSFYGDYNPNPFLAAFREFLTRHPAADVVLTLAGDSCGWVRSYVTDAALLAHIELLGHVPHAEVCQLLVQSDLLLHVYPRGLEYSVPGKLFEYLRSGRPIIAVCDRPSEVSRLLEEAGAGKAFRHDELRQLADHLDTAYRDWQSGQATVLQSHSDRVCRYSRREQARQLAGLLDELATGLPARQFEQ